MPRAKKLGMSKTDPRLIKGRETEQQAMKLRLQSMSLRKIGAVLGITAQGVSDAIERALARSPDDDLAKATRKQSIDIYNVLIAKDLDAALGDDLEARKRVLNVLYRKERIAGCHQELPQGAGGPAVAFNYYMPVAENSDTVHVDPDDYNLPRPALGSGISPNGNGVSHE